MAVDYTTTALLSSVKRRGMMAASSESLSDTDLLALASDELHNYIVPLLLSVREEFYATYEDAAIAASTAAYDIPDRAIGMKLRYVKVSDGSGGYTDLPRIEPEYEDEYALTGGPVGYFLRGNSVVLVPTPSSASGTLRLGYFRRPNRLVATSACGKVTTASTASTSVSIDSDPAGFTTGTALDIISGTSGFDSIDDGNVLTADVVGGTLTFTDAVTVSKGDYACLAGESPIPQIPVELRPLLEQRTVVAAMDALGLLDKKASAEASADRLERKALTRITPRDEGSTRKVINRTGPGWSRSNSRRGYRWR